MSRDGSGNFNLPVAAFVFDTVISETDMNSDLSDIAAALTASICIDGQTVPTADLPMGAFKHTGVGNASARNNYAAAGQIQDDSLVWCGTAGGTKNALTLTPSPAITTYTTGAKFRFKSGATPSDDVVTISLSGLTTKAAQINDAAMSSTNVIDAGKYYEALYDGTALQLTRLSAGAVANPVSAASTFGTDNSIIRADGTSRGIQSSGATATIDDSGNPTFTSTDAGATIGPLVTLDRNSASPAASDVIGGIVASGRDSGGGTDTYAQLQAEIVDATAASEDGLWNFLTKIAGTAASRVKIGAGLFMAGATSGDQGAGTINATNYFKNGVVFSGGTFAETAFSASGTFTTPADSSTSTIYWYEMVAGGGGGANSAAVGNAGGGGGGGGEYATGTFTGVAANTGITITIGTAGAAGASGATGGNTTIGTPVSIVANGGVGGTGGGNPGVGGAGGTGGTGSADQRITGQRGADGIVASGVWGVGGDGGNSKMGHGGRGPQSGGSAGSGTAGLGFGAGGAGSFNNGSNGTGVAGTAGAVIIRRMTA